MAGNAGKETGGSSSTRGRRSQKRSTFLTRTATDDAAQLSRRSSVFFPVEQQPHVQRANESIASAQASAFDSDEETEAVSSQRTRPGRPLSGWLDKVVSLVHPKDAGRHGTRSTSSVQDDEQLRGALSENTPLLGGTGKEVPEEDPSRPRNGVKKLGTFSGVFVPTSLNILSILMFIRFGFILGQTGFIGMMVLLVASYCINLITTLSISAIASNGTVRGGGAYYLISRSLGPEFGGSIGIVFYLGFVFNTGLNAVGLIDVLFECFGTRSGDWAQIIPEGFWWRYLWCTVLLVVCTMICLAGSSIFAKCSSGLLAILLISTFSIPISAIFMPAQVKNGVEFTGLSLSTLRENLLPHFTKHPAGSQLPGRENFADLFGLLFPATGGIFAGASMSSDLENPSRSISRGTLYSLALTFISYSAVILSLAATITRASLYRTVGVIQETVVSEVLIFLGELSTTFFSVLMGVIGPAKLIQAIGRDSILPGLNIFGRGAKRSDEPIRAIIFTLAVAQVTIFFDLNRLASFITMTYLMTFLVMNLACFLLTISSAPNFRPSFKWFNRWTALLGTLVCGISMFFVDGLYAGGCLGVLVLLFTLIHFTTPPKSWGDISQALAYHQVRKYLLRLRQEHVKFWRPQILLFVNNPRRSFKLIRFCNSLKKGGLFVLGHCIVAKDFGSAIVDARRQQTAWKKLVDYFKIKAFISITISPGIAWGMRNLVLNAGLGGMRPNIVILGFYNLAQYRVMRSLPEIGNRPDTWNLDAIIEDRPSEGLRRRNTKFAGADKEQEPGTRGVDKKTDKVSTETYRAEGLQNIRSFLAVLEDLLLKVHINVALARGFSNLELPGQTETMNKKRYIDLWPIQMSAEIARDDAQLILTTNFDTYTLILNLGAILNTVPSYKRAYLLRVNVFVEYEMDVEEERRRVISLLETLRIKAEVFVFWLASGDVKSYRYVVNGIEEDSDTNSRVNSVLQDDLWWSELRRFRGNPNGTEDFITADIPSEGRRESPGPLSTSLFQPGPSNSEGRSLHGMNRLLNDVKTARRHRSMSSLSTMGVSLGMRTHHLLDDILDLQHDTSDESSTSDSDDEFFDFGQASEDWSGACPGDDDTLVSSSIARPSKTPSSPAHTPREGGGRGRRSAEKELVSQSKSTTATPASATTPRLQAAGSKHDEFHTGMAQKIADKGLSDLEQLPGTGFSEAKDNNAKEVKHNEGSPGPSISFSKIPVPPGKDVDSKNEAPHSIYARKPSPASGYPAAAAAASPLSFNDLPCRAQHLILNELMTQHSADTAVIFTTLPAPVEGTHQSEADCLSYLTDLEVLTDGLPPTLLVYSNSMTVTTNL